MTFILDHGTIVWAILAVVGLIGWGSLGAVGFYALVRFQKRNTLADRVVTTGLTSLGVVGLAISLAVLFVVYFIVIGGLSIFLLPN